jgi:hypothetical protein
MDIHELATVSTNTLARSIVGVVVYVCLLDSEDPIRPESISLPNEIGFQLLKFLVDRVGVAPEAFLRAATLLTFTPLPLEGKFASLSMFKRLLILFRFLVQDMKLDIFSQKEVIDHYCQCYIQSLLSLDKSDQSLGCHYVEELVRYMIDLGLDIQWLVVDDPANNFRENLEDLQSFQRKQWDELNSLKFGTLDDIKHKYELKTIIPSSRDRSGLLPVHLAAAYDRIEVLQWLVDSKNCSLDDLDERGRNALQVAEDAKAVNCQGWIMKHVATKRIHSFVLSRYRQQKLISFVVAIQSCVRGFASRKKSSHLRNNLRKFDAILDRTLRINFVRCEMISWGSMKKNAYDSVALADIDAVERANKVLETAMSKALENSSLRETEEMSHSDSAFLARTDKDENGLQIKLDSSNHSSCSEMKVLAPKFHEIEITNSVVKWLRKCDTTYRAYFARRIQQLSNGDRSKSLSKRLTGSRTTIYETYLEQKSAHRILWTENKAKIRIWYISDHDSVSRFVRLIEDAENRSMRRLTVASEVMEVNTGQHVGQDLPQVMLDPLGVTPLKVYEMSFHEIDQVADQHWTPRLHLTPEEEAVVSK